MKILIITGSYRKKGNTAKLAQILSDEIALCDPPDNGSVVISTIHLSDRMIHPCLGCRICFDKGEDRCPNWEDIEQIKQEMHTADVLILASPVYVEDISGTMKTWIDRLAHICHRPEFGGKYAYLLTTSGTGTSGHALRTMESALQTWGYQIIGKKNFITGAKMSELEIRNRYLLKIKPTARKIFSTINNKSKIRPGLVPLIYFKVQQVCWQRENQSSIDLTYWQETGWVDPEITYYVPHKSPRITVFTASTLGGIIA